MVDTSTAPRTRKDPAQRRRELHDAARAVALESGLDAITLRAVAARAGVTPALVAHYTPSMDDLVAETFGALVAAELAEVWELLERVATPARRVGTLLDTLLDDARADITLIWVQAWGLGARNPVLAARVRHEMDAWQRMIAGEISAGMDAGVFLAGDPEPIAWHVLAMIDGLSAQSLVSWNEVAGQRALAARSLAALLGVPPAELLPTG